jgi:hypothetical protein
MRSKKQMSYLIVDNVFKLAPHKGATFVVLAALATFARPNGVEYPAQITLADRSRLSLRAVRNAIHALIKAGDVEILSAGIGVSSTQYRFAEMYMVDDREAPAAALERHAVPGREAPAAAQGGTSCRSGRHEVPGREARGAALERHAVPPNLLESVNESVNESVTESASGNLERIGGEQEALRLKISKAAGRDPQIHWNDNEVRLLAGLAAMSIPTKSIDTLVEYYRANIPGNDYRRQTVRSLLENFTDELDKSQAWKRKMRNFTI